MTRRRAGQAALLVLAGCEDFDSTTQPAWLVLCSSFAVVVLLGNLLACYRLWRLPFPLGRKLSWVAVIFLLPFVGQVLYFVQADDPRQDD